VSSVIARKPPKPRNGLARTPVDTITGPIVST
jgi:hypothetical protein